MLFRPRFSEYVTARIVTIGVVQFALFALVMILLFENRSDAFFAILLLGVGFVTFVVSIVRGAKRMERELRTINTYLANLEKIDEIDYTTHFFTQEFEQINQNLIKVLKKSKKREDIKQRYNAKLKLKNRQRADMLSAIAHEFRNPIASIMGYAQTLQDDPAIPAPLQEKFLGKIYNNGNKIESLLARLILWNKFESGEATLHKSSFDLLSLAQESKLALEESYPSREIVVEGEPCRIKADRTLMEVVLKNLIENALKYSRESVVVSIEGHRVMVRDHGQGIAPEELSKITKKFYRTMDNSWDNSMGLGLSIVKTILTLHKSKLIIESTLGEGSTFAFEI